MPAGKDQGGKGRGKRGGDDGQYKPLGVPILKNILPVYKASLAMADQ